MHPLALCSPKPRYVLLRGRKRFRLYPPQLASKMYTVGKVERVHPNGRIVFKGQVSAAPCELHCTARSLVLQLHVRQGVLMATACSRWHLGSC